MSPMPIFHLVAMSRCNRDACDKPATHELRDHYNALYGVYCWTHAAAEVDERNKGAAWSPSGQGGL